MTAMAATTELSQEVEQIRSISSHLDTINTALTETLAKTTVCKAEGDSM